MTRSSFFLVIGLGAIVVVGSLCIAAKSGGGSDQSVENTLAVQKTLVQARDYLLRDNAKKAVEILEANLNRINGDRKFLALLRDAYRAYVKDLTLSSQSALAEVYQARLKILDDNEASYTALANSTTNLTVPVTPVAGPNQTGSPSAPVTQTPSPTPAKAQPSSPTTAKPQPSNLVVATGPAASLTSPVADPIVAQTTGRPKADPFDVSNELKLAVSGFQEKVSPAKEYLARANVEFVQEHYGAAKQLFELANQAEPKGLDEDGRKAGLIASWQSPSTCSTAPWPALRLG